MVVGRLSTWCSSRFRRLAKGLRPVLSTPARPIPLLHLPRPSAPALLTSSAPPRPAPPRFELAISLGDLGVASDIAAQLDAESKWRQLVRGGLGAG